MDRQEGDDHAAEEERHVGEHAEEELDAFAVSTESLLAASDDVEVEEEAHGGTQSSHRLLAYSDALLSIIATVMVRQWAGHRPGSVSGNGEAPPNGEKQVLVT